VRQLVILVRARKSSRTARSPQVGHVNRAPGSAERDIELIRLVAAGHERAFEELVTRHQHLVFNTIHRYVGEAAAADDIAQEVFVVVWNKAATFKGRSSFSTWLYRVVINECLQFRRTRRRRPQTLSLAGIDEDRPPEALQVEPDHEQAARVAAVRSALAELPERQRIALILEHFEGRSYREIAEMMETSVSSVESLIFRAKESLRNKLTR
jgi:RNA polymerase sigma-70 factor (ECF subfamily)